MKRIPIKSELLGDGGDDEVAKISGRIPSLIAVPLPKPAPKSLPLAIA